MPGENHFLALPERRAGLCTAGTLGTPCSGGCATPPQPSVHMGARKASKIPPTLVLSQRNPPQPLPAWHRGAASGAEGTWWGDVLGALGWEPPAPHRSLPGGAEVPAVPPIPAVAVSPP